MDCFKQFVTKYLNEAVEPEVQDTIKSIFKDDIGAEILYYVLRLETNKGPQTIAKYTDYLTSKGLDASTVIQLKHGHSYTIEQIIKNYGVNEGKKWSLLNAKMAIDRMTGGYYANSSMQSFFDNWLRPWHEEKDKDENPNAKIVATFWDWYKEIKAGKDIEPPAELIKFFKNTDEETIEKAFGKYYNFAKLQLGDYIGTVSDDERLIKAFWNWHREKKNGKPYPMPENVITGMVKFLKTPKALEVMQQYYYYAVRVIEKLADTVIKTPVNLTGLQKELQRIMDNLDNDKYVDELEKIEINRLKGGDMTAGPVFVLPTSVIKSIRTMAKDTSNIDKSKVGKIDKSQVKECYVYCTNELNRKFHIGRTGIFDLNIQDFYDTYKIVFTRGFNTKTLHKIFDEVCQYLLDQLDKGTAEYWKNRGKIDVDEVDDFNEAYKLLKDNGYIILEDTEDDVVSHGPSSFDIARINQGKKPSWAKKITDIGPRPTRPKRSSDYVEQAMDSVTGKKKPYTETDWRNDMASQAKANQRIADILKQRITFDYKSIDADKNDISIYVDNLEFRITAEGPDYLVKRINFDSVMDRKTYRAKTLKDLIEWIEGQI